MKRKKRLTGLESVDFHFRDVHVRLDLDGDRRLRNQFARVQNVHFERPGCCRCVSDRVRSISIVLHLGRYRLIFLVGDGNIQITCCPSMVTN